MTKKNLESGQSLLEVIVAMSVGILVVTALVFATIFSLRNAAFAKNSTQATKLAQEGIEKVRTDRDQDKAISGLGSIEGGDLVTSWNGSSDSGPCDDNSAVKADSVWCYQISGNNAPVGGAGLSVTDVGDDLGGGFCENFSTGSGCYFKIENDSSLRNIGFSLLPSSFPESLAEGIPPGSPVFKRAVILSDDINSNKQVDDGYQNAKKVTVIVRWTDATGPHESKLSTILRRL